MAQVHVTSRPDIFKTCGYDPRELVRVADVDEAAIGDRSSRPEDLVLQLGRSKADALLPGLQVEAREGALQSNLLLTGDQGKFRMTETNMCHDTRNSCSCRFESPSVDRTGRDVTFAISLVGPRMWQTVSDMGREA